MKFLCLGGILQPERSLESFDAAYVLTSELAASLEVEHSYLLEQFDVNPKSTGNSRYL